MISNIKNIKFFEKDKKMFEQIKINEQKLLEEMKKLNGKNLIFIVGSGISSGYGLDSWEKLADNLIEKIKEEQLKEKEPKYSSSFFEILKEKNSKQKITISKMILDKERNEKDFYLEILKNEVKYKKENKIIKDKPKNKILDILGDVNSRVEEKFKIITTNIDRILEIGLNIDESKITTGLEFTENKKLYKIHGDIGKCEKSISDCQLVFTPKEYISFYNDNSNDLAKLIENSIIILLGKEIEDELAQVFEKVKSKEIFIFKGYEDTKTKQSIEEIEGNLKSNIEIDMIYYKHYEINILPFKNYDFLSEYLMNFLEKIYTYRNIEFNHLEDEIINLSLSSKEESERLLLKLKKEVKENGEKYLEKEIIKKKLCKNLNKILERINEDNTNLIYQICKVYKKQNEIDRILLKSDLRNLYFILKDINIITDKRLKLCLDKIKNWIKEKIDNNFLENYIYRILKELYNKNKNKKLIVLFFKGNNTKQYEEFFYKFIKNIKIDKEYEMEFVKILLVFLERYEKVEIINFEVDGKLRFFPVELNKLLNNTIKIFSEVETFKYLSENIKLSKSKTARILEFYIGKRIDFIRCLPKDKILDIISECFGNLFLLLKKETKYLKTILNKKDIETLDDYDKFCMAKILDYGNISKKYSAFKFPTYKTYEEEKLENKKLKLNSIIDNYDKNNWLKEMNLEKILNLDEIFVYYEKMYRKKPNFFIENIEIIDSRIIERLLNGVLNIKEAELMIKTMISKNIELDNYFSYLEKIKNDYDLNSKDKKATENIYKEILSKSSKKDETLGEMSENYKSSGVISLVIIFYIKKYLLDGEKEFIDKIEILKGYNKKETDYYIGLNNRSLIERDKKIKKLLKDNISRELIIGIFHGELNLSFLDELLRESLFIKIFNENKFKNLTLEIAIINIIKLDFKNKTKNLFKLEVTEEFVIYLVKIMSVMKKKDILKFNWFWDKLVNNKYFENKGIIKIIENRILDLNHYLCLCNLNTIQKSKVNIIKTFWEIGDLGYVDEEIVIKGVLKYCSDSEVISYICLIKIIEPDFVFEEIKNSFLIEKNKEYYYQEIKGLGEINNLIINMLSNSKDKLDIEKILYDETNKQLYEKINKIG